MLFSIYNQDKVILSQVEADDIAEAWYMASKILLEPGDIVQDVRPADEREVTPQGEITKSRVAGWLHSSAAGIAYWLYDKRGLIASSEVEDTAKAIEDIITEWRISHPI